MTKGNTGRLVTTIHAGVTVDQIKKHAASLLKWADVAAKTAIASGTFSTFETWNEGKPKARHPYERIDELEGGSNA